MSLTGESWDGHVCIPLMHHMSQSHTWHMPAGKCEAEVALHILDIFHNFHPQVSQTYIDWFLDGLLPRHEQQVKTPCPVCTPPSQDDAGTEADNSPAQFDCYNIELQGNTGGLWPPTQMPTAAHGTVPAAQTRAPTNMTGYEVGGDWAQVAAAQRRARASQQQGPAIAPTCPSPQYNPLKKRQRGQPPMAYGKVSTLHRYATVKCDKCENYWRCTNEWERVGPRVVLPHIRTYQLAVSTMQRVQI